MELAYPYKYIATVLHFKFTYSEFTLFLSKKCIVQVILVYFEQMKNIFLKQIKTSPTTVELFFKNECLYPETRKI